MRIIRTHGLSGCRCTPRLDDVLWPGSERWVDERVPHRQEVDGRRRLGERKGQKGHSGHPINGVPLRLCADHICVFPTGAQLRGVVGATTEVGLSAGQVVDNDGILFGQRASVPANLPRFN